MSKEVFTWQADCFFLDGYSEKCHTIYYTTTEADSEAAAAEAVAWVRNRQENFPDSFMELLALKVYGFSPQPIKEDGSYLLPHSMFCWEWKCDHGKPLPERKEAADGKA